MTFFKTKIKNIGIKQLVMVAAFAGAMAFAGFVSPESALASCNPNPYTGNPPYDPTFTSYNAPQGTYDNPSYVGVSIGIESSYYCSGWDGDKGGYGFGETSTFVSYTITNSSGGNMYSGTWISPVNWDSPDTQGPIAFTINASMNANSWPAGDYTLIAQIYNQTTGSVSPDPTDTTSGSFTITRPAVGYDFGCTVNRTVYYSSDPNASTAYDVYAYNVPGGYSNTITARIGGKAGLGNPTANPATTPLASYNGYYSNLNVVYGGFSPGNYSFYFRATDGTTTEDCYTNLEVLAVPPQNPTAYIEFNDQPGTVALTDGETDGTISWETINASSCTASTTGGSVNPPWNSNNVTPLPNGSVYVDSLQYNTTYTFYITCYSSTGGSTVASVTVSSNPPGPDVDIKCGTGSFQFDSCSGVAYGSSTGITWNSSFINSGTCQLSQNGSSLGYVSDRKLANPPRNTGNLYTDTTFTLTCTGPGSPYSDTDSVFIDVDGAPAPTADLTCVGSSGGAQTNGPCTVESGSTGTLYWSNTNTGECFLTPGYGEIDYPNTPGSTSTGILNNPSTSSVTYTLYCVGAGGTVTDQVTINVTPAPLAVDIDCNYTEGPCNIAYNSSVTLSWSSANCIDLSISPDPNFGKISSSGSSATAPLTSSRTYTITCIGAYGTASDSVVVNVGNPPLSIDLRCNDPVYGSSNGPCSVDSGSNVFLTWTSANCTSIYIDQINETHYSSSGSTASDPITSNTRFTATCYGPGGTATDYVDVAINPDWIISCTPASVTVVAGASGSYNLTSFAVAGFNSNINYSGPQYIYGGPSSAPSFSFSNNDRPPGNTTTAVFTTTVNTTPGTYTLRFTGVGGGITKVCDRQLIVTAPPLVVDIDCTDSAGGPKDGPCSVPYNGSATLSWTSSNCTSRSISPDLGIGTINASGSASTGNLTSSRTYTITCNGAAGTIYDSVTVAVGSDFTLACAPSSITVTQGSSGSFNLSTTPYNGFSSPVNFSGPSYSPNPGSAPSFSFSGNGQYPSATTTAFFSTSLSTTPGTYTLTFTGNGGSITKSCNVQLIVTAMPIASVSLSVDPSTITLGQTATLYWTPINTYSGNYCTAGNAWGGARASTPGTTYNFGVSPSSTGTFTYTIQCQGASGMTNTATATLTVVAAPTWGLSCSPSSITVTQGSSGSFNLSTTPYNGFSSPVTFSGPSYSPNPGSAPSFSFINNGQYPYATTTASFTTSASTTPGTYTLTFTGDGGSISNSCNVQLIVNALPPVGVTLSVSPTSINTAQTATLSWTPVNTYSGTSCTASNAWSGAKNSTAGSTYTQDVGPLAAGSYTYTIQCQGPSGWTSLVSTTLTVNSIPTWTLSCTQPSVTVTQGASGSYNLSTTPANGFASAINFSGPSYSPTPGTAPTFTFSNNNQIPSATTVASFTTTTSTTPGTYTLTFTGIGGSITRTCPVQLIVNEAPPVSPNPPTVSTNNQPCGQIAISWVPGSTPPPVTGYTVYYSTTGNSNWIDISGSLTNSTTSFSHDSSNSAVAPSASNNYYKVRANNGVAYAESLVVGPTGLISCVINVSASDKDVTLVAGTVNNQTFSPVVCSGESEVAGLPNSGIYAPGDRVTFQINVCNNGSAPLTGVTVIDTLSNLSSPSEATGSKGCLLGQSYDSVTRTLTFNVANVAAGNGAFEICSITFDAVVTTPASATTTLHRFQNSARIYAAEITSDPTNYPLGYLPVSTPPYLFGVTSNIPNRNETSPQ